MRDGGSYVIGKDGKPKLRERTVTHPEGDRPRAADGSPAYARAGDASPRPGPTKSKASRETPATKAPSKEA